jgi:hypothetical protein
MRVTKELVTLITKHQVMGITRQDVMFDTYSRCVRPSHKLRQAQGIRSRRAGAAMERVFDDERLGDLAATIDLEDVGMVACVILADAPAAEAAHAHSGPSTVPTVHD